MPKATTPKSEARRHNPLEDDLLATGPLKRKLGKQKNKKAESDDEDQQFVDSKASKSILKLGRDLAEEDAKSAAQPHQSSFQTFAFDIREQDDDDDDARFQDDDAWKDEEGEEEVEEVEVEDLEAWKKYFPGEDEDPLLKHGWDRRPTNGGETSDEQGVNLADLILEKIYAHEAGETSRGPEIEEEDELPPKVVDVFTKIGEILKRYRSGQLPKPFKILPTLPRFEEILMITKPEEWSPNATYQATRIFVSAKPAIAQRFFEMVLLEKVREDIYENKTLNVHLFNSLKRGLYKPAAWFKGFLFPLVGSGTCTLREAAIVSAVLTRVSVPVLHSAAALKGLADLAAQEASQNTEGGGATNTFIRTLLQKKYALPYQVVDALVFHFLRFRSVDPASVREGDTMAGVTEGAKTKLPVIWHQCLLAFAERYKNDITEDQREALLDLLLTHGHSAIGPAVRKELLAGRGRGVPLPQDGPSMDGDDTMVIDS